MTEPQRNSRTTADDDFEFDEAGDETGEAVEHSDLDRRVDTLEQGQTVMGILNDPNVRTVLEARRDGKTVKISVGEEEKEEEEDTAAEILEAVPDDDDSKALMSTLVAGVSRLIDKRLGSVDERLGGLEALASDLQKEAVSGQLTKLKEEHPDFDEFRKPMLELLKDNPNLSAKQLFLLAKDSEGKLALEKPPEMFSERPTGQPRRERGGSRKAETARGRRGWNKAMDGALGRALADFST